MQKRLEVSAMAALVVGLGAAATQATVIMSDSCNYADNAAAQAVWGSSATITTGLTFGSLATSDGAVASGGTIGHVLGNNPGSGSVWYSNLFKPTSWYSGGNWGGGGSTFNFGFNSAAPITTNLISANGWGTIYQNMGFYPANGTTYLAIGYLSQNDQPYNYQPGKPYQNWVFTQANFDTMTAAVGSNPITLANLNTYATYQTSGVYGNPWAYTGTHATNSFMMNIGNASAVVDEVHVGTLIDDVIPLKPSGPPTWALTGSGTWEPGASWAGSIVPGAAGQTATFADSIGASTATITLGAAKTVGTVTFANTLGGVYTVAGATLTLDGNGSGAAINVNSGSANISAPIVLNSNTTVTVAGTSTLNLPQAISGAGTVTKAGTGTASIAGASTGTTPVAVTLAGVTVNAGTLALAASSSQDNRTVLVTNGLTMGGGTLEINNNDVLVHSGSITNVTTEIGNGSIHSQSAVSDTSGRFGIGSILNTDGTNPITTTFGGQTATTTDVLIKYTYLGDSNLDGVVNGSDYTRIDAGYGNATLKGWFNGDFNYDGTVDGSDYSLIDGSFGAALTQLPANASSMIAAPAASIAGPVAVPEPTTLGLIALGATALLSRRTRRSK